MSKLPELRSEEVQEVMGAIPSWILRWGITVLFLVVATLVIGSCFFKYPDVIVSEMTLTGRYPVAPIVARASGKISKLYITDGQTVEPHTPLAVIENPASTEDVFSLKELLSRYITMPDSFLINHNEGNGTSGSQIRTNNNHGLQIRAGRELSLGEVQSTYSSFLNSLYAYENYYSFNYYPQKIAATREQIAKYRNYHRNQQRQQEVLVAQHTLAAQQYNRDSLLFVREVISPSEYETARNAFLQSRYALESGYMGLENLLIQIGEMEVNLLDLELQRAEKENQLLQNFRTGAEQVMNAIKSWELTYCLLSPIDGKVTFTKYWNENQFVSMGDMVFSVVPDRDDELLGKALLPISRSGKVRMGQRVIIRFLNFPDQEFGIVNGKVQSVSLVPAENNYLIEIALPGGLTTNYGKTLPVTYEMKASAEIVTEDLRLIERFFMPLKRVLREGF
jgi:HlyD family secretion protein